MSLAYELKETLLTLDNVCLSLGGRAILSDVNASVRNVTRPGVLQGQVIGVLGPSGIGKTQLFRVLSGLSTPDAGKVLVGTKQQPVTRGEVGVVAQAYPLFEHYTVRENLSVAARQHGLGKGEAREQVDKMLERFALCDTANAYPATLSGGQRQRIAIAQQLIRPKPLLLLDEPFSGLDLPMVGCVCRLLAEVAQSDELLTIVIVTHDIGAAISVADTLWLLGRRKPSNDGGAKHRAYRRFDGARAGLECGCDARAGVRRD